MDACCAADVFATFSFSMVGCILLLITALAASYICKMYPFSETVIVLVIGFALIHGQLDNKENDVREMCVTIVGYSNMREL
jgi:hypothetical protein